MAISPQTTKTITLLAVAAVAFGVIYLIFSNTEGATETDPTVTAHGGSGSTLLTAGCAIFGVKC